MLKLMGAARVFRVELGGLRLSLVNSTLSIDWYKRVFVMKNNGQ